jgi:hypothetical protein
MDVAGLNLLTTSHMPHALSQEELFFLQEATRHVQCAPAILLLVDCASLHQHCLHITLLTALRYLHKHTDSNVQMSILVADHTAVTA